MIQQELLDKEEELIRLRRDIHAHPERGTHEVRTSALVRDRLEQAGLIVRSAAGTGLIADLQGSAPGRTIAFRADMDCLPLTEETGLPYASHTPGLMHACGHDIHTTTLVGVAEVLAALRDQIHGTVRFLFQPDEEGDSGGNGGARQLIQAGCMDGVDAVLGCHVDPHIQPGRIGIHYGKFYAASNPFNITVRGRAAHVADSGSGIDAIWAASEIVTALKALLAQETAAGEKCVISVGTISGGTVRNIIAERCELAGAIRTLGPEARARIVQEAGEAVFSAAQRIGATADWNVVDGYMGIVNDDWATDLTRAAAEKALGRNHVEIIPEPRMTSEDFGYYGDYAPCCFFHAGAGGTEPLHSPRFSPDESAIVTAASVFIQAALDFCQ